MKIELNARYKKIVCFGVVILLNQTVLAKNIPIKNTTKPTQQKSKSNTLEKTNTNKKAEVSSPQELELLQPSIKFNEEILEGFKQQPLVQ